MKKTTYLAFLAVCCLCTQAAFAQIIMFTPPKRIETYSKGLEEALKKTEGTITGKALEEAKYKDKKTGKLKMFKELPEFQQGVIHVLAMEKLTLGLQNRYDLWVEDLDKLTKVEGEKRTEKEDAIANHTDVTHFKDQLLTLRKELAKKYETVTFTFFEKNNEMFSKEEIQGYLAQMRKYHDSQKLIERKK